MLVQIHRIKNISIIKTKSVNCLKFTKIVPGPLRQIGITNAINNIKGNVIPSIPQVKKKLYSGIIGISKAN